MERVDEAVGPTPGPLHDPHRRLDRAFSALAAVPEGAFVTCLVTSGGSPGPPDALRQRLGHAHWLIAEDHPLTFVEPSDHVRARSSSTTWSICPPSPPHLNFP